VSDDVTSVVTRSLESPGAATLVLVRHGSTDWNAGGFMTGWANPALNALGREQARNTGAELQRRGVVPSHVITSRSARAVDTAGEIVGVLDLALEVRTHWRLNERHMGALQGLDRSAATLLYGRERFRDWKRQPHACPPALDLRDPRHPRHDDRYADVDPWQLPGTESLVQLNQRLLEAWVSDIEPVTMTGDTVLVVGHCHSLRALASFLAGSPARAQDLFSAPADCVTFTRERRGWTLTHDTPSRTATARISTVSTGD
jgi:2,3-bisphosphoglycerate-dependent phosphoglycerate mutase